MGVLLVWAVISPLLQLIIMINYFTRTTGSRNATVQVPSKGYCVAM